MFSSSLFIRTYCISQLFILGTLVAVLTEDTIISKQYIGDFSTYVRQLSV